MMIGIGEKKYSERAKTRSNPRKQKFYTTPEASKEKRKRFEKSVVKCFICEREDDIQHLKALLSSLSVIPSVMPTLSQGGQWSHQILQLLPLLTLPRRQTSLRQLRSLNLIVVPSPSYHRSQWSQQKYLCRFQQTTC